MKNLTTKLNRVIENVENYIFDYVESKGGEIYIKKESKLLQAKIDNSYIVSIQNEILKGGEINFIFKTKNGKLYNYDEPGTRIDILAIYDCVCEQEHPILS